MSIRGERRLTPGAVATPAGRECESLLYIQFVQDGEHSMLPSIDRSVNDVSGNNYCLQFLRIEMNINTIFMFAPCINSIKGTFFIIPN